MIKLSRFQIAAIKRTVANTKKLVKEKEKVTAKIADFETKLAELEKEIDLWESPIKSITGGYTAEEILAWGGQIPENEDDEAFLNLRDLTNEAVIVD